MKPTIDTTTFGSITINGNLYDYDVMIGLNGHIRRRMKELSSGKYGTSHKISLEEAIYIFEKGAKQIIIGTGQTGYVVLSEEANQFFKDHGCTITLLPTPRAILAWNSAEGFVVGVFHVTC
ncbi:Mth938-like domain-containing protein [Parabacteroides sp. FAFU027]|uniref:Mth938-like domain-containing protein n=1 Tax=Parabacteroides sp. FAFU027 TaxID=2922715 RepID=UPI001FAECB72|nr:Mth938-like domain-containing protein [Parabacteroides sp. FAFU027]